MKLNNLLIIIISISMISLVSGVPTVTLNNPADGSEATSIPVLFNVSTSTPSGYINNVSLYGNFTGTWLLNQTISSVTFQGIYPDTVNSPDTGQDGMNISIGGFPVRVISVGVWDNVTATKLSIRWASNNTIISGGDIVGKVYTPPSPIVLEANTNYFIDVNNSGAGYQFFYYIHGTPLTTGPITWVNPIKNGASDGDGFLNIKNITMLPFSPINFSKTINTGFTFWNVQACDNAGSCAFATSNFSVSYGLAPVISVSSPASLINYGKLGMNLTLNFSATDAGLSKCWYNYNGTNTTIDGCVSGVYNITNITLTTQKNLTVFANDTSNNNASQFVSWNYIVFENSQTYNSISSSGVNERYIINLTYNSTYYPTIIARLNYNGTNYTASKNGTGDTIAFYVDRVTNLVNTSTNYSFFWYLTLTNSSGVSSTINTSSLSQTISTFLLDDCSSYNLTLLNFTMKDEETQEAVNGTINVNVNVYTYGTNTLVGSYNKSFNYVATNSSAICIQNISNNYSMSYSIQHYPNSTYFTKFRNIQRMTINQNSYNQNITLYNLKQASGYTFRIIVVGNIETSNGNKDLLVDVQRQYLSENLFKSVESSITGNDGNAIVSLVTSSVVYNFVVSYNGVTLGTFNNYRVQCQNLATLQCTVTLNLASSTADLPDFTNYGNITQVLILDQTTHVLTQTFNSRDGNAHTVDSYIYKGDNFGNTTICNNSAYGTSGAITCNIPLQYQNSTFFVRTTVDGVNIGTILFSQGVDVNWYGVDIFIELLMLTALVLLFVSHPITIIIGAVIGLVAPLILVYIVGSSFTTIMGITIYYILAAILAIIAIGRNL